MWRRLSCLLGIAVSASSQDECVALHPLQAVSIHEFLAANTRTNPDLNFGDYSNWIELHNGESYCIDLSGAQ